MPEHHGQGSSYVLFFLICEHINGRHKEVSNGTKSKHLRQLLGYLNNKPTALDSLYNQKGGESLAAFDVATF